MQTTESTQAGIRVGVSAVIVRDDALLLVEFDDETGLHYNLPGGGVELGESLHDALRREVREETCLEADPGRLLLVWEYVPEQYDYLYGRTHKLGLAFLAHPKPGSEPELPAKPDANQTGVRWVSLADLPDVPLLPAMAERLSAALHSRNGRRFLDVTMVSTSMSSWGNIHPSHANR